VISVILVDEHTLFREGLKCLLGKEKDIRVIGDISSGLEVQAVLDKLSCDVLILEISLPGKNGLDIIHDLQHSHPALPVLILTMHPEDLFAYRAIKTGASGYLSKKAAPEELLQAIRKIASGHKYITETLAESLAAHTKNGTTEAPHEKLSDREFEVLQLIASGQTVSEIAKTLCLSVKTVSTYRNRLLEKMEMRTNAELTVYGIKHNLV